MCSFRMDASEASNSCLKCYGFYTAKYTEFSKWKIFSNPKKNLKYWCVENTVKHKKTWTNTNAGKNASRCISFVVTREIHFFVLATSTLKCNSVSLSPWDCDYTLSCFVLLFLPRKIEYCLCYVSIVCVLSKLSLNAKQNISIDVMAFFTNLYRSSSL